MKNRGFTLVELLAVIVLIGLVALATFEILDSVNKENKQKAHDIQANSIINSAIAYVPTSDIKLPSVGEEERCITLEELYQEGIIEEIITNPLTGNAYDKKENHVCILEVTSETKEAIENELKEANIYNWKYDGNYIYYFKESGREDYIPPIIDPDPDPDPNPGHEHEFVVVKEYEDLGDGTHRLVTVTKCSTCGEVKETIVGNPESHDYTKVECVCGRKLYYEDVIAYVYLNGWGNQLSGFSEKKISSFLIDTGNKTTVNQLFDNETWKIPSQYTITHVYVYASTDTWVSSPLAVYVKSSSVKNYNTIYHDRLSNYQFKRNADPDKGYIGSTNNGSLRFVIIVTS